MICFGDGTPVRIFNKKWWKEISILEVIILLFIISTLATNKHLANLTT